MYVRYVKRLLDVLFALAAIIFFWWLFIVVAILVRVKLGSPVLFSQERPGKDEKIFRLYKFRTMTDERDEDGNLLPDEVRLTAFGKALRASSLDEIPEIFNILKGDMSLIGPRPLLVQYLPLYNEEQRHRHDVRPGLTGWAQINGRNAIQWEDKFKYDLEYVNNCSFTTDVKVFLLTIKVLILRQGISSDTSVTMEVFSGNKTANAQEFAKCTINVGDEGGGINV